MKRILLERKKVKLFLFLDNMIVYIENPMEATEKPI